MDQSKQRFLILIFFIFVISVHIAHIYSQNIHVNENVFKEDTNSIPTIQLQDNRMEVLACIKKTRKDCRFGTTPCGIGDINQDGYDDMAVGDLQGDSLNGIVYIYYGGEELDTIPDVLLRGKGDDSVMVVYCWQEDCDTLMSVGRELFGSEISSVGDINGDGFLDFVVGAPYYKQLTGRAYLYYGGAAFDTIPDLVLTGEQKNSMFGCVLTKRLSHGDVNNDGYDDILISAVNYTSENLFWAGRVYLYYGGEKPDTLVDWTKTGESGDNNALRFGHSLALGDVNNDRYDDILVQTQEGRVQSEAITSYIFFGGENPDTLIDYFIVDSTEMWYDKLVVNDYNNDNLIDFSVSYHTGNHVYFGGQEFDTIPDLYLEKWPLNIIYEMVSAGDVNGDRYQDILAGAPHGALQTGTVGIYLGGNPMNGEPDLVIGSTARLGRYINGAGDVNGDGYDDIILVETLQWSAPADWVKLWVLAGNPDLMDIGTSIENSGIENVPDKILIYPNYPNPFNSSTTIKYEIERSGYVQLIIYDLSGKAVKTLVDTYQVGRSYNLKWDGKNEAGEDISSGIYFIILKVETKHKIIKAMLIR